MSEEKIYCGNARVIKTNYGGITKVSFHKNDINKMIEWLKKDGGDWINIAIMEKKDPMEGKPTHYGVIDTWKPTGEINPPKPGGRADDGLSTDIPEKDLPGDEPDDLPF